MMNRGLQIGKEMGYKMIAVDRYVPSHSCHTVLTSPPAHQRKTSASHPVHPPSSTSKMITYTPISLLVYIYTNYSVDRQHSIPNRRRGCSRLPHRRRIRKSLRTRRCSSPSAGHARMRGIPPSGLPCACGTAALRRLRIADNRQCGGYRDGNAGTVGDGEGRKGVDALRSV